MKHVFLSILLCCSPIYIQSTFASNYQQQNTSILNFSSEYGFEWQLNTPINYKNFYLVGSKNGKQVAFYETRTGEKIAGISVGQTIQDVTQLHGQPLEYLRKNDIRHMLNYSNKYNATTSGVYLINGQYIQYLYDSHNKNRIRAILVINEDSENQFIRKNIQTDTQLRNSFEQLMGHLLNQSRVAHQLPPLLIAT